MSPHSPLNPEPTSPVITRIGRPIASWQYGNAKARQDPCTERRAGIMGWAERVPRRRHSSPSRASRINVATRRPREARSPRPGLPGRFFYSGLIRGSRITCPHVSHCMGACASGSVSGSRAGWREEQQHMRPRWAAGRMAGGPVVGRGRRPAFAYFTTPSRSRTGAARGVAFVFLRVTCILLKSCELAKGNPFGNSGQGGWCLVLILFPCQQLRVFSQVLTTAILLFLLMILQQTVPLGGVKTGHTSGLDSTDGRCIGECSVLRWVVW